MAIAKFPDGKTVDLKYAQILPGAGGVVALLVEVGDVNANGNADVTVAPGAKLPLLGAAALPAVTVDLPVAQALEVLAAAGSSVVGIPGAGGAAAAGVKALLPLLRALLPH